MVLNRPKWYTIDLNGTFLCWYQKAVLVPTPFLWYQPQVPTPFLWCQQQGWRRCCCCCCCCCWYQQLEGVPPQPYIRCALGLGLGLGWRHKTGGWYHKMKRGSPWALGVAPLVFVVGTIKMRGGRHPMLLLFLCCCCCWHLEGGGAMGVTISLLLLLVP